MLRNVSESRKEGGEKGGGEEGGGRAEEGGGEGAKKGEGPLEKSGEGFGVMCGGRGGRGRGVVRVDEAGEEMGRENGCCFGIG